MRSRIVAVLTAVTVLGLAAAPALARSRFTDYVAPFKSVGGIPIKATPAKIRSLYGKPSAVFHENGKISGFQYEYGAISVQIDFDTLNRTDGAMDISASCFTPSQGHRLHSIDGIRIGTSAATARRRLSHWKSFRVSKGLGFTIERGAHGNAGEPGSYLTSFSTSNGKIDGMGVSYVFNDD